jgi:cytochrome P450 monooxygenase-2
LTCSIEWHEITLKSALLDIVARLSSRVFLGDELCRNADWLRITKEYTVNFFFAATELRLFPKLIRPYIYRFVPRCQKLMSQFEESQRIIWPVVLKRREARMKAIEAGERAPNFNDALDWIEQEAQAKGRDYNPARFQLNLSMAAIHTTTDLLEQCLINLAENPECIPPIRDEIVEVLKSEGWQKTSLYKMKRLDSAIKESQRLKPSSIGIASSFPFHRRLLTAFSIDAPPSPRRYYCLYRIKTQKRRQSWRRFVPNVGRNVSSRSTEVRS